MRSSFFFSAGTATAAEVLAFLLRDAGLAVGPSYSPSESAEGRDRLFEREAEEVEAGEVDIGSNKGRGVGG